MTEGRFECIFDVGSTEFVPICLEGIECIEPPQRVLGTVKRSWDAFGRVYVSVLLPNEPEWGLQACMIGAHVFLRPTPEKRPVTLENQMKCLQIR